jgi:hypothetical protein
MKVPDDSSIADEVSEIRNQGPLSGEQRAPGLRLRIENGPEVFSGPFHLGHRPASALAANSLGTISNRAGTIE